MVEALEELSRELERFQYAAESLLPDLVLRGITSDVYESSVAVGHLLTSPMPHKAYSNARLAFEGAQNALVLATHERYDWAGALAWVFFDWKDRNWRVQLENKGNSATQNGDEWLDRRITYLANVWNEFSPGQGGLLCEALKVVRQKANTRPDNWLHENMTARHDRAYELIAAGKGRIVPMASVNREIYAALCRESHTGPRLDSFKVQKPNGGVGVKVEIQARDLAQVRKAVASSTELCLEEAAEALRYRRRRAA